ncbi:MAG: aminomethyl-transferring glycine dehydrogenase subunit GcvPA [Phycisphaerae bacterium]
MPFIANTDEQRRRMLAEMGLSADDLFADIPERLRSGPVKIPDGLCEHDVLRRMNELAGANGPEPVSFLGGGAYDHFIPSAVDAVLSRSEFFTAYTPYQPECSQGTLQAMYEYQTGICRLTGMEVANASLYDGGTAIFEAVMMAMRLVRRRNRIVVSEDVNPIYRRMLHTYLANFDVEIVEIPPKGGLADRDAIVEAMGDTTAAVVVQTPNFFGLLDDFTDLAEKVHETRALLCVSTYPIALGLTKPPGEMGADIVTGDGQSLGLPLSFGGPYLGFMATRGGKFMRKMPGRLVGRTVDVEGKEGFVLTLQPREQHIRREKATSNICTNQGLCALAATTYLSLMGKTGFAELATLIADKTAYARERLAEVDGVDLDFADTPVFNEFVVRLSADAGEVAGKLLEGGIAAGLPLGNFYDDLKNALLVAVTEKRTRAEIDRLADALEEAI